MYDNIVFFSFIFLSFCFVLFGFGRQFRKFVVVATACCQSFPLSDCSFLLSAQLQLYCC